METGITSFLINSLETYGFIALGWPLYLYEKYQNKKDTKYTDELHRSDIREAYEIVKKNTENLVKLREVIIVFSERLGR